MDDRRKEFFNERAEKWLDMWYKDPVTGAHSRFEKKFTRLFSLLPIRNGDRILDIGCGSGVLVPHILNIIGDEGRLVEADYAEKMIEVNRGLHPDKRITFCASNADELKLSSNSSDGVICFAAFPHFDDKLRCLQNLQRILKPGGWLAIAHFLSSAEIAAHHNQTNAVMHDILPDHTTLCTLFNQAELSMERYIDQSGFYLALGLKQKTSASL